MTWRCPVCRSALVEGERSWSCGDGHSFDIAREGYVNLLVTHQRRARPPGDSAAQLRHRRAFLEAGHYQPVADAIAAMLPAGARVVDVGCGEGWYDRHIGAGQVWGVDIAKEAVRLAAKRATGGARYAVGSAYDLPVVDGAADVALAVFAPMHSPELVRVAPRVLTVTPGPSHLAGLAALLFDEPEPHASRGPLDGALPVLDREVVAFDLELRSPAAIADLLGMTPWTWYVDQATRRRAIERPRLETPVETILTMYGAGEHDGPHG